jgi:hypothetical protein
MQKSDFYQARLQALQEKAQNAKQRAKCLVEKSELMCEKLQDIITKAHKNSYCKNFVYMLDIATKINVYPSKTT